MSEKTCDQCWEFSPCECEILATTEIGEPSFKILTEEQARKQREASRSPEIQKLLYKLSLRNFRDAGMVTREEFEARLEYIEKTGKW